MPIDLNGGTLVIGRGALAALRQALTQDLGEQAAVRLQEAGHAGGVEMYDFFVKWLAQNEGLEDPGALDASALGLVLSTFFTAIGWGTVVVERVGRNGLALDAPDWAEADPAAGAAYPSCYFSAGLLGEFVGRLANRTIAVMEVECRSASHARCRFLLGAPETLEAVYDAMSAGRDYASALGG
ncbi:MAG TPA: V4R domain-containing protein [Gemmatimonadales bacterium]|nr:V4R domain-containing protein [Gemmatimonadales bacterium]